MTDRGVGVALPVYNGERFLEAALRSVLAQSYPVGDVIVVDDGSVDASQQVARAVGPPVRVLGRPHAGAGATRSLAMSLVHGEFILPLDADDLLTPTSIETRVRMLLDRPEVDVVYGQVRSFRELSDGRPVPVDQPHPAHVPDAMLIRRVAYERVGPFAPGLRVAECLDWLLRARELGLGEATVPDQVLWRRVHGANNSLTGRGAMHEFPRALKASLDRRRASGR
jgi:glycosyltransferase involved in cell wall biosynthesis